MKNNFFWQIVYIFWPPVLRFLELIRLHRERQPFLLGKLMPHISSIRLREHLVQNGFEDGLLAWRDPGEILNMRKIDKEIYQYHIRLFYDFEVRGHYGFSSEGNPIGHMREEHFEPGSEYFKTLLDLFLQEDTLINEMYLVDKHFANLPEIEH